VACGAHPTSSACIAPTSAPFKLAPWCGGLRSGSKPWVAKSASSAKVETTRDRTGDRLGHPIGAPACGGGAPGLLARSCQPIRLWLGRRFISARDNFRHAWHRQGCGHRSQRRFDRAGDRAFPTDGRQARWGGPSPGHPRPGRCRVQAFVHHCRKWTNRLQLLHVAQGAWWWPPPPKQAMW